VYEFYVANSRAERNLREFIEQRNDIKDKLDRLKDNPRKEVGAHPNKKQIIIEAVGSHKIY
jgi:hypothetical protein